MSDGLLFWGITGGLLVLLLIIWMLVIYFQNAKNIARIRSIMDYWVERERRERSEYNCDGEEQSPSEQA